MPPRRLRTLGIVIAIGLSISPTMTASAHASGPPRVVPAFQQWTAASGSYQYGANSRVVVAAGYAGQLATTADVLVADLTALTGSAPARIVGGSADLTPGAIYLTLGDTSVPGVEGHRVIVSTTVTISAATDAGVFDGTRSLLQLLRQSRTIPAGTARDWAAYKERNLMVDTARKFYSVAWLKARVRELSYLKFNTLHLHLSDNEAFRLESSTYPDIVSNPHYSKAEITDLIAYAARYHVDVVPEIDMPGHMGAALKTRPDIALDLGPALSGGNRQLSLDLSKPAAWTFAKNLLTEYLPLFPGTRWHLGADEWLNNDELLTFPQLLAYARQNYGPSATGRDAEYAFINWADCFVRARGKTMRIWNDQFVPVSVVRINADVAVEHWYGDTDVPPQAIVDEGHRINNANWQVLYAIPDSNSYPDAQQIYTKFQVRQFAKEPSGSQTITAGSPALLGTQLSIWSDNKPASYTEADVAAGIRYGLRSLVQITWGSPKPSTTYTGFKYIVDRIGDAP